MGRGLDAKDRKTKKEFIRFLKKYKTMRFFQAVTNFTNENLDSGITSVYVGKSSISKGGKVKNKYEDTFFWECDEKLGRN